MWTSALLKSNAKICLRNHHWNAVVVCLLSGLLGASSAGFHFDIDLDEFTSDGAVWEDLLYRFQHGHFLDLLEPIIVLMALLAGLTAVALLLFVGNALQVGSKRYFLSAREQPTPISMVFSGFKYRFGNTVMTMFLRDLYIFLWSLLCGIPGIIKSYEYRMVPHLLAENPNMAPQRALSLSKEMMMGRKMDTFLLDLSFIGWEILSSMTCGILGLLYVAPYVSATNAELYTAIRTEAFARGLTDAHELPGFAPAT